MRVVIFGAGNTYQQYRDAFRMMEIVSFVDNDEKKWGSFLDGCPVVSPAEIVNLQFDYIFLVSIYHAAIRKQLLDMGIPQDKIIGKEHQLFFDNLVVTENYTFPRDMQAKEEKKRILLISHTLDLTGAPVVLCRLAQVLKHNGYEVTVYAEKKSNYGNLLYQLLQEGISVSFFGNLETIKAEDIEEEFDLFWVNTIVLYHVVEKLLPLGKKVYWWLHETDDSYKEIAAYANCLQAENLYVFAVGWMAAAFYEKYAQQKITKNLLYGIPDFEEENSKIPKGKDKIRFGLVGTYGEIKGQDILYEVIARNYNEWKDTAEFLFVGRMPEAVQKEFEKLSNIHCMGEVSPERLVDIYERIDVLICPSRFDSMPVVVSEAMQHRKVCLVTDKVGQSRYIADGVNGLVCKAENEDELTEKIRWILEHPEELARIGEASYGIFEDNFSMKVFEKNVLEVIEEDV